MHVSTNLLLITKTELTIHIIYSSVTMNIRRKAEGGGTNCGRLFNTGIVGLPVFVDRCHMGLASITRISSK